MSASEVTSSDKDLTFPELLEHLHAMNFSGPVTLHFRGGQPMLYELGTPKKFTLRIPRLTKESLTTDT